MTQGTDLFDSNAVGNLSSPELPTFHCELLLVKGRLNVRRKLIRTRKISGRMMAETPPAILDGIRMHYVWDQAGFLFSLLEQLSIPM